LAITGEQIKQFARECGFELAGIASALPTTDFSRFEDWRAAGFAADMGYLTDRRGDLRADPRHLAADARSILCVGKLYNTPAPHTGDAAPDAAWISRYAWGADYHEILREGLAGVVRRIEAEHGGPFSSRICVDTAPLLERSYARAAGLGWIGKNTCLINQSQGSWFFLGELLLSIPLAPDLPAPERCGTCRECIDACPTRALVPDERGGWTLDSRLCISYLTIENRGAIPAPLASSLSNHVFGCDICQDVCPWNRRAGISEDVRFAPSEVTPRGLADLSGLTADQFREVFRRSPVWRAKYAGFLRNVAAAMGNAADSRMLDPLVRLAGHPDALVAQAARQALEIFQERFVSASAH
jgi:epoxyqueuosine reductase